MSTFNLKHLLLEGLCVAEAYGYAAAYLPLRQFAPRAPKRYGKAVLVLPGLLANDTLTMALRELLKALGYDAHGWAQGLNYGPTKNVQAKMEARLIKLYKIYGKVSLVGWSLGGVYARELARRHPDKIRQVITLGSPCCSSERENLPAPLVFAAELITDKDLEALREGFLKHGHQTPPVPCTSIFSKTDGVVSWQACQLRPSRKHQNVEVFSTHMGLICNPSVLWVIANRLAQKTSTWRHFVPPKNIFSKAFPA